ncbi:ABC transporter ATP-binding protein [Tabrizicola sp.]|uniref:ABC transporter ATP-binding protein n=1 Tax=Tabrizicola sp. TaxID=2005166 RepID=UPI003F401764
MLKIERLSKTFGTARAVDAATFDVAQGELVCLLGPSGCGKSTLLRMISGLADSDDGQVMIEGQDMTRVPANRRPTAMVFQSHALWNHMTVAQNVAFGLRVRGLPNAEIAAKVAAALDLVGLAGFGKRRPADLSGGQAQRVALARCLVVEPKVLLMDEPFSALDAHLRKNLREELKALQHRLGLTIIFVTHDQEEAMELADRIAVMDAGRIEQIGAPDALYMEPRTLTVARFIGTMNIGEALIEKGRANWYGAEVTTRCPDGPATILCRPEDFEVSATGIETTVTRVIDLGPVLRVHVVTAGGAGLIWLCPRSVAPTAGAHIRLTPRHLHVYRDGQRVGTAAPLPVAVERKRTPA